MINNNQIKLFKMSFKKKLIQLIRKSNKYKWNKSINKKEIWKI